LDKTERVINKAKTKDIEQIGYFLAEMGFLREKARKAFVLEWIEEFAPYESGRDKRYFVWRGDIELMYSKYFAYYGGDSKIVYERQTFEKIVEHERIGIHTGDVFYDDVKKLYNLMTEKKKNGELVDENEYQKIKKDFDFNQSKREFLHETIQGTEQNPRKVAAIVDFSQNQLSVTSKFTNFAVVLISNNKIDVPESLKNNVVNPEKPITMTVIPEVSPSLPKRKRGPNLEKSTKPIRSHMAEMRKQKNVRELDTLEPQRKKYKPHYLYFHFVMKQFDGCPGQISPYVQHCIQMLFDSGIFDIFDHVQFISDNCSKHNKTYLTHVYFAFCQEKWRKSMLFNNNIDNLNSNNKRNQNENLPVHIVLAPSRHSNVSYAEGLLTENTYNNKNNSISNNINSNINNQTNNNINDDSVSESETERKITFHTLGPRDAHNPCDTSFSHGKRVLKKDIGRCSIMESAGHMAWSYSRLNNFFLILVSHLNFPGYMDLLVKENFMMKTYDFSYEDPIFENIICDHKCKNKRKCKHPCCKDPLKKVVYVSCTDRDGVFTRHRIIINKENLKNPPEENEEACEFWDQSQTNFINWECENEKRTQNTIDVSNIENDPYDSSYDEYNATRKKKKYILSFISFIRFITLHDLLLYLNLK
jgi:hypothetical protein